jgi:hypothetical protein
VGLVEVLDLVVEVLELVEDTGPVWMHEQALKNLEGVGPHAERNSGGVGIAFCVVNVPQNTCVEHSNNCPHYMHLQRLGSSKWRQA